MTTETKPKAKRQPPRPGAAWRTYKVAVPGSTPKPARTGEKRPVSACAGGGGHHWRIASPEGGRRMLPGVCRKCGAERAFAATDGESGSWLEQRDAGLGGRMEVDW